MKNKQKKLKKCIKTVDTYWKNMVYFYPILGVYLVL